MGMTSTTERRPRTIDDAGPEPENEMVRRLVWSGLTLVTSAIAAMLAQRASAAIWKRAFNEEPPE